MKLFSFSYKEDPRKRLGAVIKDIHFDLSPVSEKIPSNLDSLIKTWDSNFRELNSFLSQFIASENKKINEDEIIFHPPTTDVCTFRDFYAFLNHVKTARSLRGLDVIPEWYEIPVFYFSNPNVFLGHKAKLKKPVYTDELDFELEIACIIGMKGINIPVEEALNYIAGFTILNDFSARDIQRKEMKVGLGPAKSKDFASGLGPYLVTPDEFSGHKKNKAYDIEMKAFKNGQQISAGNFSDIYFSFAEMISRASSEVELFPGDVIGSGTVGTGCILELRPENTHGWLKAGDDITLEIERLGQLRHTIV